MSWRCTERPTQFWRLETCRKMDSVKSLNKYVTYVNSLLHQRRRSVSYTNESRTKLSSPLGFESQGVDVTFKWHKHRRCTQYVVVKIPCTPIPLDCVYNITSKTNDINPNKRYSFILEPETRTPEHRRQT